MELLTGTQLEDASTEQLRTRLAEALRGGWLKAIEQVRRELERRAR